MNTPTAQTASTTTATHTPGPWKIGVRQPTSDKFIYGPDGTEVADCDRKTNFNDENLANARLIASAPELLATLKWAHACAFSYYYAETSEERNWHAKDLEHAIGRMEQAIAKAEGCA